MKSNLKSASFFQKAEESLGRAEDFAEQADFDGAALSCYHAVFFSLRGSLIELGINVERTSKSIDAFHAELKARSMDTDAALWNDLRFVLQLNGYAQPSVPINDDNVRLAIEKAAQFIEFTSEKMTKEAEG